MFQCQRVQLFHGTKQIIITCCPLPKLNIKKIVEKQIYCDGKALKCMYIYIYTCIFLTLREKTPLPFRLLIYTSTGTKGLRTRFFVMLTPHEYGALWRIWLDFCYSSWFDSIFVTHLASPSLIQNMDFFRGWKEFKSYIAVYIIFLWDR